MSNPAVAVAKSETSDKDEITVLSTGIEVYLRNVNAATIAQVTTQIKDPAPPVWFNESKGREEVNPLDPIYLKAMERADQERGNAVMDALALFGIELVNGLPTDTKWLKELRLMDRLGHLDLSDFDFDDPIDLEFLYKKHVVVGTGDWSLLMAQAGISEEAVTKAEAGFHSEEA